MVFNETEKVELKRMLNDSLPKEIVAFLNSFDGTIYIGVDDNGNAIGVDNLDDTQRKVADIITTQILPNPQNLIELGTKFVDGKNVIEIKVRQGKSLYYIKKYGRSASGCFVRIGTTCRSMTEEEIEHRYILQLSIPKMSMKQKLSPRQDLTFAQFQALLTFKGVHFNREAFEQNFNLRNDNGQFNYIAFLVSDQNDTSIKVVRFNGVTKASFLSRKEFTNGCIFKQMEDALDYSLNVLNIIQTDIVGTNRIDTPYFDTEAFREAWFNAVCHNLWVEQTPPAIYGFDDRVEIISYGLLADNMTKEEFFNGISKPINEEFAKIFMQLHYIEQSGKGVPTIISKYGKEAYHFGSSFIQCILPYNILDVAKQGILLGKDNNDNANNAVDKVTDKDPEPENVVEKVTDKVTDKDPEPENVVEKVTDKVTDKSTKVLSLMSGNPTITIAELANEIRTSRKTINGIIKHLKEQGIIERVGSDRKGYWKIIK